MIGDLSTPMALERSRPTTRTTLEGMERPDPLRAAELAWALLRLYDIGISLREAGLCTGPLTGSEISVSAHGVTRTPIASRAQRRVLERRRDRHLRDGHDLGCLTAGVPTTCVPRMLAAWGAPCTAPFATALAAEVTDELRASGIGPFRGWSASAARETVEHVVTRRITPKAPRPRQSNA